MNKAMRHYEDSALIPASPEAVFGYADDQALLSSHMSQSSWMMGGGRMDMSVDDGRGQKVGSHIRLSGKAFGIKLFLDEVVTRYEPPRAKIWETVGAPKLLVLGHYRMGLEINTENEGSRLKVFIDYELPTTLRIRWLGYLFGRAYAKWCVKQMIEGVQQQFSNHKK